jgi:hypothetical protein
MLDAEALERIEAKLAQLGGAQATRLYDRYHRPTEWIACRT